jgi:ribulose bisphosphate carboxylase small subunit
MKRITVISPAGDKIEVTQDQVKHLVSQGWKVEVEQVVKSKVKVPKEVV